MGNTVGAVNGRVWEGVRVVKGGVLAVIGGVEGRDGAVYEGMARGVVVVSRRLVELVGAVNGRVGGGVSGWNREVAGEVGTVSRKSSGGCE